MLVWPVSRLYSQASIVWDEKPVSACWLIVLESGMCWCRSGNEVSSLAPVAVSWFLQVSTRCLQKDSFPQLLALTISSTLNEGKGNIFWVNLIHVAVQLQDAGAWPKRGGGNECVSMRKCFLQHWSFCCWLCVYTFNVKVSKTSLFCGLTDGWRCFKYRDCSSASSNASEKSDF